MNFRLTTLLFLLTCFFINNIVAQKIEWTGVKIGYLSLPKNPLPPDIKTYSVEIGDKRRDVTWKNTKALNNINIFCLKKVAQDGDIKIVVFPGSIQPKIKTGTVQEEVKPSEKSEENPSQKNIKKRSTNSKKAITSPIKTPEGTTTTKNSKIATNSKPVIKKIQVSDTIYYRIMKVKVLKDKEVLHTYRDTIFRSESSRNVKFRLNLDNENYAEEKQYWSNLTKFLKEKIDKYPVKESILLGRIKKIKHEKHELFNKATDLALLFLGEIKAQKSLEETILLIDEPIQEWMLLINDILETDKKQKKLLSACYYNLFLTFYALDDFEKAEVYAEKLLQLKFKKLFTKSFLNKIEKTKVLLETNKVSNRHINQ